MACTKETKKLVSKLFIQGILLIIFLIYFGLPSFKRYQEKKVLKASLIKSTEGVPAPAITVCARDPGTFTGWKSNHSNAVKGDFVKHYCEENITNCIETNTYSMNEIIDTVERGCETGEFITDKQFWIDDFTDAEQGRCHTLRIPDSIPMKTNYKTDKYLQEIS